MKHWPPVKAKKLRSPDRGSSLLEGYWMNEVVVQALSEYLYETGAPEALWPEHWFVEVSTSRWIAGELIDAILDHPMDSAEDIMEEKYVAKKLAQTNAKPVEAAKPEPEEATDDEESGEDDEK